MGVGVGPLPAPHEAPHSADKDVGSCPTSQIFLYNLTTCQQTCRSLSEANTHCLQGFAPVDGCGCPDHTFLDEKGHCVPLAKCSCYHHGLYLQAGKVVMRQGEQWWVSGPGWVGMLSLGSPWPRPAQQRTRSAPLSSALPRSVCRNARLHCTRVRLLGHRKWTQPCVWPPPLGLLSPLCFS